MFNSQSVRSIFTNINDGNMAFHVVDKGDYNKVKKNRNNLTLKYGISIQNLKYMDQVHENKVCIVGDDEVYKCDALVTNKTKTPLMIMSADCIGILFYDSVKKVIAVAHAGRNGTFLNISSNVIQALENEFSSNPSDIKVVLGPSIQKCCYEVLPEMVEIVRQNFGEEFCDGRNIDLQGINKKQLLDVGLKEKNINISSICTKCNGKDYFSYRNDKNCGRFAGIIELN